MLVLSRRCSGVSCLSQVHEQITMRAWCRVFKTFLNVLWFSRGTFAWPDGWSEKRLLDSWGSPCSDCSAGLWSRCSLVFAKQVLHNKHDAHVSVMTFLCKQLIEWLDHRLHSSDHPKWPGATYSCVPLLHFGQTFHKRSFLQLTNLAAIPRNTTLQSRLELASSFQTNSPQTVPPTQSRHSLSGQRSYT